MNTSTSSGSSITALVPGGVVTTQNISTVIKPKENNNSMQFVKIQTPELSKSAVEQIRVAEESKISKNKIKEVEEEWQSNLLNWKSKRRQQFVSVHSNNNDDELNNNDQGNGRKIKTFAEMIEQRAKTGNRLNFHLQRYIGSDESQDENSQDADGDESNERNNLDVADATNEDDENHSNLSNDLDLEDREEVLLTKHVGRNDSRNAQIDLPWVKQQQARQIERADSHSSIEDDDRGEIEEQKHLQRVAFVAKLKAFERMTQPTMNEPKFVPTKTAKQPPPPPQLPVKQQQQQQSSPTTNLTRQLSPISRLTMEHAPESPPTSQQQSSTPLPADQLLSPVASLSIHHSPVSLPQQQQPPQQPQLPQKPQHPPVPMAKQQKYHPPAQPKQQSPVLLTPPPKQQNLAPTHQPRQSQLHQQIPPRMSQQSHPQPLQQHAHQDDKAQDRTVLSVSGKKRCSSCKEELGRGAAAFVIESLNLVYHTNCFRCSVCHVNLSNGFRGVDVRVHAGALHCQNCYSKDGLNYSRV